MSWRFTNVPLVARLALGIAAGVVVGLLLGRRAELLGEVGVLVVRLLKALATPLVFVAIVDSVSRANIPARKVALLLAICGINTGVAGALAVGVSRVIAPAAKADSSELSEILGKPVAESPARLDPLAALREVVPESVAGPFVHNHVLSVVLLALLTGTALRRLRARGAGERLAALFGELLDLLGALLHLVIELVPLAVFGVVAKVTGTVGFSVFVSLGALVATVTLGLLLHVLGYYSFLVAVLARRSPVRFFRAAGPALTTAFATGSSMATLPVTLRTLERDLGVSPESARLAACVGTNFNNDGIMLYEVVVALFVARLHGVTLDAWHTAQLALTSAIAAAGIAGVPEAGLITLSLVLSSVGLPLTSLPILLTVDWALGRLRAMTNVSSDLVIATLLDAFAARRHRA